MAQTTSRVDRRHPTHARLRVVNAFTRWVLRTPMLRRLADHQVCELRFAGARSRRSVVLPVMYAQRDDRLAVLVGGADHKLWWRSFTRPHPVRVLLRGAVRTGTGHIVAAGAPGRAEAAAIYAARFPELPVQDDPIVIITLDAFR